MKPSRKGARWLRMSRTGGDAREDQAHFRRRGAHCRRDEVRRPETGPVDLSVPIDENRLLRRLEGFFDSAPNDRDYSPTLAGLGSTS